VGERVNDVVFADGGVAGDDDVADQARAFADGDVRADGAVGADFDRRVEGGAGFDDGGWVH
jgi:hypothetical protein